MPASNYPNGFANGVTIRGMPLMQTHPGAVFWVDSTTGSNGNAGTFARPFSTIDYAIGRCTASRGDIIMVKPGHTETVSAAGGIAADVAGVAVIGLGVGSNRPTVTLDTATTATVSVSAANFTFKNIIFTANFADIVSVFTLTTAKYFTVEDCYIKATATNMNFLYVVDTNATTADADGLALINNKWIEPDTATETMVKLDGTNADVQLIGNYVQIGVGNNKAALLVAAAGKIVTALQIGHNKVYRLNTDTATGAILYHTDGTTSTGMIWDNRIQHADTAAELLLTASNSIGVFENRASGVAGASGYLLPAADS